MRQLTIALAALVAQASGSDLEAFFRLFQPNDVTCPVPNKPPEANYRLAEDDGKCRILAMRGGGTKGAYEAGILRGMVDLLPPQEMTYDVVEGISIGSFIASVLSTFDRGDEERAIEWLEKIFTECEGASQWGMWPTLGIFEGLWKQSLLDSDKLHQNLRTLFKDAEIKRGFVCAAVDINEGKTIIFDDSHITTGDELAQAVTSSASIPVFFPPQQVDNHTLVDGGLFANMMFSDSILKCREKGFEDSDIIVDIILCQYNPLDVWKIQEAPYKNAWDIFQRKEQLRSYYYTQEDVFRVARGYPDVTIRYVFEPSAPLTEDFMPIFDSTEKLKGYFNQGVADATNTLKKILPQDEESDSI